MKTKYFLGVHYGLWVVLLCAIIVDVFAYTWYQSIKKEKENKEIFLKVNSIGCSRWEYNGSKYWRCPDKSINSVDVVGYKGYTKQEPVIKGEIR